MSYLEKPKLYEETVDKADSGYLGAPLVVRADSLDAKTRFAHGLGEMLSGDIGYLPDPDELSIEIFQVRGRGDEAQVVLIDIAPRLSELTDDNQLPARRIQTIGSLLYDEVCSDKERGPVLSAFVLPIAQHLRCNPVANPDTFDAFTAVYLMSQGMDFREQLFK